MSKEDILSKSCSIQSVHYIPSMFLSLQSLSIGGNFKESTMKNALQSKSIRQGTTSQWPFHDQKSLFTQALTTQPKHSHILTGIGEIVGAKI